jgi:hypothetical protein|tara:strand:+ start:269 stop:580 length:312 start_codon:yes stop_codon:yes gene_type:complete
MDKVVDQDLVEVQMVEELEEQEIHLLQVPFKVLQEAQVKMILARHPEVVVEQQRLVVVLVVVPMVVLEVQGHLMIFQVERSLMQQVVVEHHVVVQLVVWVLQV